MLGIMNVPSEAVVAVSTESIVTDAPASGCPVVPSYTIPETVA